MSTILVDLWGRPYPESERLEHNQRVNDGAPYAELLNVDDMLKRYGLLQKPKRVFDLVTGYSCSPGEFHAIYTASNVRVGRKRVAVSQMWMQQASDDVWFHSVDERGEIEWQGQLLGVHERGRTYLVLGDEGGEPLEIAARLTKGWKWYCSAEEMSAAYERACVRLNVKPESRGALTTNQKERT